VHVAAIAELFHGDRWAYGGKPGEKRAEGRVHHQSGREAPKKASSTRTTIITHDPD
jgi:hypothetical protein